MQCTVDNKVSWEIGEMNYDFSYFHLLGQTVLPPESSQFVKIVFTDPLEMTKKDGVVTTSLGVLMAGHDGRK